LGHKAVEKTQSITYGMDLAIGFKEVFTRDA
jgi:hypothetical protein